MSPIRIYVRQCRRSGVARLIAIATPIALAGACTSGSVAGSGGATESVLASQGQALSGCPSASSPDYCTSKDPCRHAPGRCRDRQESDSDRDDSGGWHGHQCPPVSSLQACTVKNPCHYDLNRCDYAHADLPGFVNEGSMERTNFSGANLAGARLTGNTEHATLAGANLTDATFARGIEEGDLTGATVTCAVFESETWNVTCPGLVIGTKGSPAAACVPKGLPRHCLATAAVACPAPAACQQAGVANASTNWVCTYANAADGTACNDGNACTQTDTCEGGTCTGTNPVTCAASDQCHVAGTCDPSSGQCSNPPASSTTTCNDGNLSTYSDQCDGAGNCVGTPVVCPADTQCTTYSPNGTSTCTANEADPTTTCDDGNPATYADHCDGAGSCLGTAVTCPANTQCMTYSPNGTSTCTATPVTSMTACDDGNIATYGDMCDGAGSCVGTPVVCPASTQCTAYSPNGTATCTANQASPATTCNDGNLGTYADHCDGSGRCSGTPVTCPANTQCTSYSPNGSSTCTATPASAATACDDGSLSTYGDHCDGSGTCTGTTVTCPANTQCTTYSPNGTSTCTVTQASAGTTCNDGNLATYGDHCDGAGSCTGTPMACPANTQCTTYSSNGTSTCTVTQASSTTSCNDGNSATYGDHCDGSGSCIGTTVTCPANTQCMNYAPNGTSTCSATPASAGTTCNDGNLATYGDQCNGNGTCAGTPVVCPANNQCATYTPNGTATCTESTTPNGTSCDNGYICDEPDTCQSGACVGNRGLISSWRAESNALDATGHYNATPEGTVQYGTGAYGQAFQLSGGSYVDTGSGAGNFGANDFTIEFWLHTTATNAMQAVMSKRLYCGTEASWWDLRMNSSGGILFEIQDSVTYSYFVGNSTPVNDGAWHYVAVTRHANTYTGYVDGSPVASASISSTHDGDAVKDVRLGLSPCDNRDGTLPFSGSLDEISFYSRALTPGEVAAQSMGTCIGVAP